MLCNFGHERMEAIRNRQEESSRGLSLFIDLNWDRLLYVATIIIALGVGGMVGAMLR